MKLDSTEIPYPPPQNIIEAAKKSLGNMNKYITAEEWKPLLELLSEYSNVDREYLFLSSGSDIIIKEAINVFSRGRNIVTEYPSLPLYSKYIGSSRKKLIRIRLNPPNFNLDPELLINIVRKSLVVIENPNNPTGIDILDRKTLESILEDIDTLVIIDEAYYEFSGITFADLVKKYPNLMIIRTLDKAFGLAGLRIGYAICGDVFRHALQPLRFTLSRPSTYAAIEALKNIGYMQKNVTIIIKEREKMRRNLEKLGVKTYPSKTNFFLIKTRLYDLADKLEEKRIRVFDLSNIWLKGFIRVSVGTPEENDFFLENIEDILKT